MSLREEMWKYEQITGESAEHVPIIKLGAFLDGYEMGLKALEQRWIPVSERLPEPQVNGGDKDLSGWVLVSLSTSDFDTVCSAFYCFSEKKWYRERVAFGTVTAWMPLLEPYKGESEDKE